MQKLNTRTSLVKTEENQTVTNLIVGAAVTNSMNIELQSIQDDELRISDNAESNLYDSRESASREIGFEMKIVAV